MKVVHILNELRFSGAEILLTSAATVLQSVGPSLVICTGSKEGNYANIMRTAGYTVIHIPFARSPAFLIAIRQALRDNGIDLVHIHTERAAVWYSLICATLRIPSVRTVHNEFRFTGMLKVRRKLNRRFAAWLGTRHVACSPSVQRVESIEFGLKTIVINNWFDPKRIKLKTQESRAAARDQLGIGANAFVATSISNEAAAKNLDNLFRGITRAQQLGCPTELFHCGEIGTALRDYAIEAQGIHAVGNTNDVHTYLAAADVFVCTSYNEGGQLVLLEAAASGTTCITTKVGLAELLDGQDAVRFIEPTSDSLGHALVEVSRISQGQRRGSEVNLAEMVNSRFGPATGANCYVELYKCVYANRC